MPLLSKPSFTTHVVSSINRRRVLRLFGATSCDITTMSVCGYFLELVLKSQSPKINALHAIVSL